MTAPRFHQLRAHMAGGSVDQKAHCIRSQIRKRHRATVRIPFLGGNQLPSSEEVIPHLSPWLISCARGFCGLPMSNCSVCAFLIHAGARRRSSSGHSGREQGCRFQETLPCIAKPFRHRLGSCRYAAHRVAGVDLDQLPINIDRQSASNLIPLREGRSNSGKSKTRECDKTEKP